MKKNNVALLYLSIDYSHNGTNWNKDIATYNLEGFHYFATERYNSELRKLMNNEAGIPHYFLFDTNGKLIDNNLPRPSTGQQLFDRIAFLLTSKL